MPKSKVAYFQGGGGVNEPTPGEKKYKSDPAIVVQPRFEEPFYHNYDLYTIPGMEHIGPGTGYHALQNYKSVAEFLKARRDRLKPRYVADDSWQIDSGKRVKNPDKKARIAIFEKIIKTAKRECQDSDIVYTDSRDAYICGNCKHMSENCLFKPVPTVKELHSRENHNPERIDWRDDHKENDPKYHEWKASLAKTAGPNYDLGKGLYDEMSDGKIDSVKEFREEGNHGPGAFFASDNNDIDFPIDEEINHDDQMIYPSEETYHKPTLIGPGGGDLSSFPSEIGTTDQSSYINSTQIAGEHSYLPLPDQEDRSDEALNFGRDYTGDEFPANLNEDDLKELSDKYLEPTETGIFGLPDGVDPEGHDADQTEQIEQPFTGTSDIGTQIYDDKWNI